MAGARRSFSDWLLAIDRRIVYLLVLLALAAPLCLAEFAPYTARKLTMKPAPLRGARQLFDRVERIVREREETERAAAERAAGQAMPKVPGATAPDAPPAPPVASAPQAGTPQSVPAYHKIVLISADFGPQTRAELLPMLECTVRHLMMRRIKFAIYTNVPDGAGYCKEIPEKLARELGCTYGQDWANFGYKPNGAFLVRQMATNIPGGLKTDVNGTNLEDDKAVAERLPCMSGVKDAGDVSLVVEITGLVGLFGQWPAFFATPTARPDMAHGCTSVSIPDAYSDLESGLICGLYEGIAGAATYNDLLDGIRNPAKDPPVSIDARVHMTAQTVAHLLIIAFVVLGNFGLLFNWLAERRRRAGR